MDQEFQRKTVEMSTKWVVRNVEEVCQKVDGTTVGGERVICNQVGKAKK